MNYVGSKRRIKKYILPILQEAIDSSSATVYIEPFGGGANVIDDIKCENRYYYDVHPQLTALLEHVAKTQGEDFPSTITEENYQMVRQHKEDFEDWYVGLVGFCPTFGSKYFGGYGRSKKGPVRDKSQETMRNLKAQAPKLRDVHFTCADFRDIEIPDGAVVYCDPPYRLTTNYRSTKAFPYEEYYDWCRNVSKRAKIFMSEAEMPEDFKMIWEKELRQQLDIADGARSKFRPERLYTI